MRGVRRSFLYAPAQPAILLAAVSGSRFRSNATSPSRSREACCPERGEDRGTSRPDDGGALMCSLWLRSEDRSASCGLREAARGGVAVSSLPSNGELVLPGPALPGGTVSAAAA
jgi:hypothetical protein